MLLQELIFISICGKGNYHLNSVEKFIINTYGMSIHTKLKMLEPTIIPENNAVAYAYGLDVNVHGEFVEGIESFFKLGLLSTKEDILDDQYTEYYNESGERIIFGFSDDQVVVDSAVIYPGVHSAAYRPAFNFGALVQDQMPGLESFTVQMGMQFGTRLPYGPPDPTRYKDTLRMKSYFRVDLGMSYDFWATPRKILLDKELWPSPSIFGDF